MTPVAQTRFMLQNEYAPGVGITEGAELNQAGAWCMRMGYVAVPHFAQHQGRVNGAVPMTQNNHEIMGSAAA